MDYRKLNSMVVPDNYPLPVISDLLSALGTSAIFSQIDLRTAFHQVGVDEKTQPLLAFKTQRGHYTWSRSPMGIRNMPSVFQRLINQIFANEEIQKNISAYLDDILVHSKQRSEHLGHLRSVLECLNGRIPS